MIAEGALPVEVSAVPLIGWRCWFVLPEEGLLRPIFKRGLAWKPRQALEAICPDHIHAVPDKDCKCGVWCVCHPLMLREPEWMTTPPSGIDPIPGALVVGQVALWGDIIEHERGWRAAFAYPTHLYLFADDERLAATLRDKYAVPVAWGAQTEDLRRLLPRTPATPAINAATTAPAGTPLKIKPSDQLLRILAKLPKGPLRDLATSRVISQTPAHNLDSESTREMSAYLPYRDQARARLAHALERGGYYTKSYGDQWRSVLIHRIKYYSHRVVLRRNAVKVSAGDVTATRRVAWLLIARRWTETKDHYRELARLRAELRRTRSRFTGKPLAKTTIYQRRTKVEGMLIHLDNMLNDLATIPTPSYRAWRELTGK